jgi:hypothetical protein
MFSVGHIRWNDPSLSGKTSAKLSGNCLYVIDNPDDILGNGNDFIGLFEYADGDQFCRFVKMDEIDLKYC